MVEHALLAAAALAAGVATVPPAPTEPSPPANCERTVPETAPSAHSSAELDEFSLVGARLVGVDGDVAELCLLVADTPELQARGLMGVDAPDQLDGADGMVFVWAEPVTLRFYMWRTPMPLTIAFFDEEGRWLAGAEMEPCLDVTAARCARYSSPEPYVAALEVPAGPLAAALGPGAVLDVEVDVEVDVAGSEKRSGEHGDAL